MKPFDARLLRAEPSLRRPVAALALVAGAQGAAAVALAFALAHLISTVVTEGDWSRAAWWLVGAFAARAALGALVESLGARTASRISATLRRSLLQGWLRAPLDERPSAEGASTLATQGASAVEPYAARFLPALVAAGVVPALAVVALLLVDPLSAVIVVVTLPLLPLFAALIGTTTQDDTMRRWRALEQLAGHFGDVMRGLPTLVAFGRARRQVEVVRTVSQRHRTATMRTLRLAFLSSAALELLATISVAIVAVCVGLRLSHGSMSLHAGLLAILLAPEAYWPIRRVGAEFHAAADGAAALDAILGQRTSEGPAQHLDTATGGVRVGGVSYGYPGSGALVIDGLSFTAGAGLTAVTGPSGAGKSTLLDLVAGLREPVAGTVDGGRVHYVTQRPFLPDGPVADVLRLGDGRAASDDLLWQVLDRVGLAASLRERPEGLGSPVGDDGVGLSAGQRTRLALARALLSTAPVLLLDEPTAHLDSDGGTLVTEVVRDLATDRCVIAVTHDPAIIAVADARVRIAPVLEGVLIP